jgi:endonuclease YncB( thermonuclease family)
VKVVDGDTIAVELGATREKVRYVGIDTPVLWSRRVIPSAATPERRR